MAKAKKVEFIKMEKEGAELAVHPSNVVAHEKAGWKVVVEKQEEKPAENAE